MPKAMTFNEVQMILGAVSGSEAWLGSAPLSKVRSDEGRWFWVVRENERIVKIDCAN